MRALVFVFLAAVSASAQRAPAPKPWTGAPLDLTAGLNTGIRKILLRADGRKGRRPSLALELRLTDPERLHEEAFVPFLGRPVADFAYAGRRDVDEDGNRWTAHRWTSRHGVDVVVCHPVRAVGPAFMAHFERFGFDVAPDRPPFALVVTESSERTTPYPLRDLSRYADPERALLLDRVPLEPNARRHELLRYLLEKLREPETSRRREAIEQLAHFDDAELRIAEPALLALRQSKDGAVARAAGGICRRRHLFSQADVLSAARVVESGDAQAAAEAFRRLRRAGPRAAIAAERAVRERLKRGGLPAHVEALGRAAAEAMRPQGDEEPPAPPGRESTPDGTDSR